MRCVWLQHGGEPDELPRVDFNQKMVVAMFVNAGEYTEVQRIQEVIVVGNRIEVRHSKFNGDVTTINPCSVIAVPRAEGIAEFLAV